MNVIVLLVIFFFILVLAAAIVAAVWLNTRSSGSPGIGQTCTSTCTGDLVCSSGLCLLPTGGICSLSSQCADNSLCVGGRCLRSIGSSCTSADQCSTGLCSGGICSTNLQNQRLDQVIDAAHVNGQTILTYKSGLITVDDREVETTVYAQRLAWCWDHLYCLSIGSLYRLRSTIGEDRWEWDLISVPEAISHISTDHQGRSLWLQNRSNGSLSLSPSDLTQEWTSPQLGGTKILGPSPDDYIMIEPEGLIRRGSRTWIGITSAVLSPEGEVVVERDPRVRLVVLDGEVVALE